MRVAYPGYKGRVLGQGIRAGYEGRVQGRAEYEGTIQGQGPRAGCKSRVRGVRGQGKKLAYPGYEREYEGNERRQ